MSHSACKKCTILSSMCEILHPSTFFIGNITPPPPNCPFNACCCGHKELDHLNNKKLESEIAFSKTLLNFFDTFKMSCWCSKFFDRFEKITLDILEKLMCFNNQGYWRSYCMASSARVAWKSFGCGWIWSGTEWTTWWGI